MRPQNHACRFEEIFKIKLQASAASSAKTLRSQNRPRAKYRLRLNGLRLVHGRLFTGFPAGALARPPQQPHITPWNGLLLSPNYLSAGPCSALPPHAIHESPRAVLDSRNGITVSA